MIFGTEPRGWGIALRGLRKRVVKIASLRDEVALHNEETSLL
jgi:hypothetical protein